MNIRLRDVEPGDLPLFFEHQRDAEAAAMAGFTSRDRAAFDEHWAKLLADDACLEEGSALRRAGRREHRELDVAWRTRRRLLDRSRAYWGRGVASAALSAFLQLERTRPLYASLAKHNVASLRVLQKCGFTPRESGDDYSDDSEVLLVLTGDV
jgi:RimJ/RimL family protein N-acetyltransferase